MMKRGPKPEEALISVPLTWQVMVFRQVDLDRFAWMRENADQKRREAEDMARARGMPYIGGGDIAKAPPPLFEHTVSHRP